MITVRLTLNHIVSFLKLPFDPLQEKEQAEGEENRGISELGVVDDHDYDQ